MHLFTGFPMNSASSKSLEDETEVRVFAFNKNRRD